MDNKRKSIEDQISAIAMKWADDVVKLPPSRIKEQVYHDTNSVGLTGMLSAGKLWLTDYRFLNDKAERIFIQSVAEDIISDCEHDAAGQVHRTMAEQVRFWQKIDENEDVFVFSLSEGRDDLSQW